MKKQRILLLIISIILISFFVTSSVLATAFVAPDRVLTRVEDEGDILTDEEESLLRAQLDEISERHNVDVIVVTNYSLGGKSPMEYADDFFDYNGYGMGEDYDGVLFLLSMEYRDWWISTHAYGITAFTDYGIDYIGDKLVPYLSDGDYYKAFSKFGQLADEFITQAKTGEPFDVNNKKKAEIGPIQALIIGILSLVAGGGAGSIYAIGLARTHRTKSKAISAGQYRMGAVNFVNSYDRFRNKTVTRSRKPEPRSSSGGGGGGSSTHTSSSGRSHGGGGGKF